MGDCKSLKPQICGNRGLVLPSSGCDSIRFTGAEDVEINQGVCIDLTEGVHAYDGNGNEIPFTVSPTEISCCDIGEYEITYTATGASNRMLPSMCLGNPVLHIVDCDLTTITFKRTVTIIPTPLTVCEGNVCCSVVACS